MNHFVELKPGDDRDRDWVNLSHVARVLAEAVADDNWVVKVQLSTGVEIIDSRQLSKEAAEERIVAILPGDDA